MMHSFLVDNRDALIERCKVKVAARPKRVATEQQLAHGVPMFLEQLTRTLEAEERDRPADSIRISGPSGGDLAQLSEIGTTASVHGEELLALGFSVDQVVHDYGDLCQAITDLAFELHAPFTISEFRTLNRCLDNAIADAVTQFSIQREASLMKRHASEAKQRLGFLAHELRNALNTATLAVGALEFANMPVSGATGAILKRSLSSLKNLVDRALTEVRYGIRGQQQTFSVADFIAEAALAARLDASASGCQLVVLEVDVSLTITGNRALLHAALANLLQNGFKFTHAHSEVELAAHATADQVLIEVRDHCGGLPAGSTEKMFMPFTQRSDDKSGLGLGLSIARQSVEGDGGSLTVTDLPEVGCVFTIALPRTELSELVERA